jgi:hypothetical protein
VGGLEDRWVSCGAENEGDLEDRWVSCGAENEGDLDDASSRALR